MNDLELLRRVGDAPLEIPRGSEERARARLEAAIDRGRGLGQLTGRGKHPRGAPWALRAGLGIAAALVALLVLVVVVPDGGGYASASELLRSTATVADEQPWRALEQGQFVYVRSQQVVRDSADSDGLVTEVREEWIAADGSGRVIDRAGDQRYAEGELTFVDPSELPTDPRELEARLREGDLLGSADSDVELLEKIAVYLGGTYAPPQIRSALYEVAAKIPGIELVRDAVDPAGRPGTGVTLSSPAVRIELVVDPEDSRLLSWTEHVPGQDPDGEGRLLDSIAYLEIGVVGSTDDRPGDGS